MTIAQSDPYGELYDLKNDPHEMDNLFEDAPHRGCAGRANGEARLSPDGACRPQPVAHQAILNLLVRNITGYRAEGPRRRGAGQLCRSRRGIIVPVAGVDREAIEGHAPKISASRCIVDLPSDLRQLSLAVK